MRNYTYPGMQYACNTWECFRKYNDQDKIIRELERGCYNYAIACCNRDGKEPAWDNSYFTTLYSSLCYKLYYNILNCESLMKKIIATPELAAEVATWTSEELNAAANYDLRQLIELRRNQKVEVKVTTQNKCPRCKAACATIMEYQSRSIDEGTRVAYQCQNCTKIFT